MVRERPKRARIERVSPPEGAALVTIPLVRTVLKVANG